MNTESLGRLEKIDLRKVWGSEPAEFTPWLAKEENLELLGDTLGIELELKSKEENIGQYRADIVCKDTSDGSWVLIENQLEATNHPHLGQIITYAAGLDAVTVVWIAERFTEEHRAALDWLNEISGNNVRFFGLEIEVWKIGNSSKAPKFNIVSQPNDWTKDSVARISETELTDSKKLQLEFWRGFRDYALEKGKAIKPQKAQAQHWMNIALGSTGIHLDGIASLLDSKEGSYDGHELRAEVSIDDRNNAKAYYNELLKDKVAIETEVGESLTWYNPDNARVCRIYLRCSADLDDIGSRERQYSWLLAKLELLHKVFANRAKTAIRAVKDAK